MSKRISFPIFILAAAAFLLGGYFYWQKINIFSGALTPVIKIQTLEASVLLFRILKTSIKTKKKVMTMFS